MKIHRFLLHQIEKSLSPGKVTVLYGPRQVGKTTLVRSLVSNTDMPNRFINTDELFFREALSSQNARKLGELVGQTDLLVIDEAQRVPEIGLNLKILVDHFPSLRIIATGSASFELANKISEPLTGRKLTYTLFPVSFAELQHTLGPLEARQSLERWLIWGGYPEIITTDDLTLRRRLMNELVSAYLYRDLLELEDIRRSAKILDLLRLLAFQIGSEVSQSELASQLSINIRTVQRYLDLLEKVFVIYRVEGFSRNLRKEISKNARYYFFDNGVRNALIQNFNPLSLRDDAGQLWENFLYVERWKANQYNEENTNRYFWRTYDQKEIDLVEEQGGQISAYEFKYTRGKISKATRSEFTQAYPGATISVIHHQNFEPFIA